MRYVYAKYFRKERFRLNVVVFLSLSVGCNCLPVSVLSPFSNLKDPCPLWWCATIQLGNMLTLKPHLCNNEIVLRSKLEVIVEFNKFNDT